MPTEAERCVNDFGFLPHLPAKYEVQFNDSTRTARYATQVCEDCAPRWRAVRELHLIRSLPRVSADSGVGNAD